MKKGLPFVSVVVCTYNRCNDLDQCLASLGRQIYPKDRYEVIVVDDHSTDDTFRIARMHDVRIIEHKINQGVAAARNSGITAAKGEIVAYIDDDAIADSKWLLDLIQPFDSSDITVSCGRVFAFKTEYLIERYLAASGCGSPAPQDFKNSKHPFWRFLAYVKNMFTPINAITEPIEVQAGFGANVAYRKSALLAIGNFDEALRYDEDSDISARLRRNGARIIFIPQAIVYHRYRENLKKLLRQTYRNAENTLRHYMKEKKTLPIFPFPLIYLFASICLAIINPMVGIWFITLGPLALYCWWIVRAIREHNTEYLLYGYIQLTIELATIVGLLRAKIIEVKIKNKPA